MIILRFDIFNNIIKSKNTEFITTGSYRQVECNFTFIEDTEWKDLTKIAIFISNNLAYSVSLENDKCFIPAKALENPGDIFIGVIGTKIENNLLIKRNTTNLQILKVYEGSFCQSIEGGITPPSIFEEYLLKMNDILNTIKNFNAEDIKFTDGDTFQKKYDNGEFVGEKGNKGDKGDKGDTPQLMININGHLIAIYP